MHAIFWLSGFLFGSFVVTFKQTASSHFKRVSNLSLIFLCKHNETPNINVLELNIIYQTSMHAFERM